MLNININHAYSGFLYAPLFLADEMGYLPKNMKLNPIGNDEEAFMTLCEHQPTHEKHWFAICDPFAGDLEAAVPHSKDRLCVVAIMINRLPVWVYNENAFTNMVEDEKGLRRYRQYINNIVSYENGTTGYVLSKRIQRLFDVDDTDINECDFGEEFDLLKKSMQRERTAVVTSDVLQLVNQGLNKKKIIFNYPTKAPNDLNPYLFTAVLTLKNEVVENNLWAVLSLLAGLKNALTLLKNQDDEAIEIVTKRYEKDLIKIGVKDYGEKKELVGSAIKYLFEQAIYPNPELLQPDEDSWNNAKKLWEDEMSVKKPSIEKRNEPIPALLIKENWRRNSDLREYLTGFVPNIKGLRESNILSGMHVASIPISLLLFVYLVIIMVKQIMITINAAQYFDNNIAYLIGMLIAFIIYASVAYLMISDLVKSKINRYNYLVATAIGMFSLIFAFAQLIKS